MSNQKVSLILTTYNCEHNLLITLESIERQTYENVEVVIKDGGSTDQTLEVIKDYQERSKYKVLWKSCKDIGIYDAMNQGYSLASGDIIVFFNDCFLYDEAVQDMVETIAREDGCIGAHADLIYADGEKVIRRWKMGKQKSMRLGWMPGHPTLFLKREVYEKYGVYKTDYKVSADYEFMIRILKDSQNRLAYLPKCIIKMYYGGTSTGNLRSYWISLKEGHRALTENGVKGALIIDLIRSIRVILQFVKK